MLHKKLEKLKHEVVGYTREKVELNGSVDPELINLIMTMKRLRLRSINIKDLQHLPNDQLKITIDMGFVDGLLNAMQYKVFHNGQMDEIGSCKCNIAHHESSLVVTKNETFSRELFQQTKQGDLEVRLIDPHDPSRLNLLLANL